MPGTTATAPGKIILFGEHAVVYGQPAIAAPVRQVGIQATVTPALRAPKGSVQIQAPIVGLDAELNSLPEGHPVAEVLRLLFARTKVVRVPAFNLRISGNIPVAAGLGSGAAVSVAILRAVSAFLGRPLEDAAVNDLAFEIEKIYHGTPSGVDNTVITYARPVYYVKGKPLELLRVGKPFEIVIGDTGIASPTSQTVGNVRKHWLAQPEKFESLFANVGALVQAARQAIEEGKPEKLGELMNNNHQYLCAMGVSAPALDKLVTAARSAGAAGAKLSGGGGGGNMIALVQTGTASAIQAALEAAGAVRTLHTTIQ